MPLSKFGCVTANGVLSAWVTHIVETIRPIGETSPLGPADAVTTMDTLTEKRPVNIQVLLVISGQTKTGLFPCGKQAGHSRFLMSLVAISIFILKD